METEKKSKMFKLPHTYVILVICILVVAAGTYLIPAGQYDRVDFEGRQVVDVASYAVQESNPTGFFELFKAIPQGMQNSAQIIFFIFIVAGCFNIVMATGSIEKGIGRLALVSKGKEKILIPFVMFVFSMGGATFGLAEELVAFVPIGIALSRAIGYDAMVGTAIIVLGGACGFDAGFLNPFTVGVAQSIAQVPMFSGFGFRLVVLAVMLLLSSLYVLRYAKKVKADPRLSLVADLEEAEKHKKIDLDNLEKLNRRDVAIILSVIIILCILVFGVFKYNWYLNELAALFIILGLVAGFIGGFGPSRIAAEFVEGAKGIVFGALVVGIANSILVVMQNGMIIDSVVHGLASLVSHLPKGIASVGMMLIQVVINFFIPSGSGQAAATMPIMTPLADVIGITRQTAVLAYQFGDGFSNTIIPTSAALMGNLSIAKISFEKWIKFVGPLILIWIAMGAVFMIIATATNYGPF